MKNIFAVVLLCMLCLSVVAIAAAQKEEQGHGSEISGPMPDDWFNNIQEVIRKDEYRPSVQFSDYKGEPFSKPRLHFANRIHNLRVYFDENGIELMPRVSKKEASWTLKIKFPAIYHGVQPNIIDNKVVYQYEDIILEYVNSELGIVQSIVVRKKPKKEGSLFIKTRVVAEGLEIVQSSPSTLTFSNKEDKIVYQILNVNDVGTSKLQSSVGYDEFGYITVSISHKDTDYPIYIKSLISSTREQTGPHPDISIASLRRIPDWTAESDQGGAYFGTSVSTAGDVNGDGYADVIVGASYFDNGEENEGRVYVYHGSALGLDTLPSWIAESNSEHAYFGYRVSTAGDIDNDGYADVIIGAPGFGNGEQREGRAYVYHGSASGLDTVPAWTAEGDLEFANIGEAAATAGDVNNDGFADVIIGGDCFNAPNFCGGRAYVYHGSSSGLDSIPDWFVELDFDNACFGRVASTAGDVNGDGYADIIVGAPRYEGSYGRVYVYHGSASGLDTIADWIMEIGPGDQLFGRSVSTAGDVDNDGYADVIIGAPYFDNGEANEGAAFVYLGSDSGLSQAPYWIGESDQEGGMFGYSVSTAGDVNNDGRSDIIVGAIGFDHGESDEGCAFVYYSRTFGFPIVADMIMESDQAGADCGYSVSTAGDINNDGYADVIIGAPYFDNGEVDEGRAYVYHGKATPLHTISADTIVEPSEHRYEEFSHITPSAVFRNAGFFDEYNIPVSCFISSNAHTVYISNRIIDFLAQGTDTLIVFDDFTLEACGSHYEVLAFCSLPDDTFFIDDTTKINIVAARIYELPAPGCNAWKYPNADSGFVPYPTDPNWLLATQPEMQQISALDSSWWVTAGATDSAHQDLQLYGFQFEARDTLIEEVTVEWWGHHGDSVHQHCALYFWDNQAGTWSQRAEYLYAYEDVRLTCDVPVDSIGSFVSSWGYMYVCAGGSFRQKYSCPLLFTFNGEENVFIGDVITGCDIGMWLDRFIGNNLYLPPDYDEYVKIDGDNLQNINGRYRLTVNEMLQEVSYLDEVKLYVIDHPVEYDVYPHEALLYPAYQGLKIHTSEQKSLKAAIDENGCDVLPTLEAEDRVYLPFERSGIIGFAKPFTVTFDVGELDDPGSAVLYFFGSTRFQDSDEIEPVSDIYRANKLGMKLQNPRVEVIDASGRWMKVASCGMPRGHKKTVTYPLYDENTNSIFATDDHRLRITFYTEVYLDKAWVSCHKADDYRLTELEPEVANLHYYGYADYYSPDGKYPGDYYYDRKVMRDYANVVGYYTKYGDVRPLLKEADSKFVIMCHGDEIVLEFAAEELAKLPEGWKRDFVIASKGFYKMARSGRAYAYSVEPLPFCGMRADMSANGIGYYPYDPSPGLVASLLGRIYAKCVWDYPFSLSDAISMIELHLTGNVKNTYPEELAEYRQEWNTRHVDAYYPVHYADAPPHLNLEKVPLHEREGTWTTHLASLGVPFGDHSLHSNYVRVWLVTTVPVGLEERKIDVPKRFAFNVVYPNPFRESTRMHYTVPSQTNICLNVYDLSGRFVRTLVNSVQQPGSYSVIWDGTDNLKRKCASGIYFVNFSTGERFSKTRKLILLK